ncbi:MAG: hypothetical protein KJ685_08205 [Nanoarchaeota archaeon]|nr:hypothetical protein [Nanoarchaeota archaeon]
MTITDYLGDALKNNHPTEPKFRKGYKLIASTLSALILTAGMGFGAEKKLEYSKNIFHPRIIKHFSLAQSSDISSDISDVVSETSTDKKINLTAQTPTQEELYKHYFEHAQTFSHEKDKESQKMAVDYFTKAINLNNKQALLDSQTLDTIAHKFYNQANALITLDKLKSEGKEKKKKSALPWIIGGLALAGGVAAAVLLKKKPDPVTPDTDYNTNLNVQVINHTQGILGNYTINNVMTSSQVTISIDEIVNALGLTNVDDKRIAVRGPLNDCKYLDFDRDGDVIFTVNRSHKDPWNFQYTLFLFNASNGTNYGLIDEHIDAGFGKLRFGPNATFTRRYDTVTGPENLITEVVNQLNSALSYPWMTYGSLKKVDSGGDFLVYYDKLDNKLGIHGSGSGGYFAVVDPNNCQNVNSTIKAIWNAEIFELMTETDDLGGRNTNYTITDYKTTGNLNTAGKELLAYIYVKDTQTIGSVATNANASAMAMLNAVDINTSIEGVNVGIDRNGLRAGIGNKKAGVNTTMAMRNNHLQNMTNAYFALNNFNGQIGMILTPDNQIFSARGDANLKGVVVGGNGMYDARTGANNMGFTIGTASKNSNNLIQRIQAGYNRNSSPNNQSQAVTLATGFQIPNLGSIGVTGSYTSSEGMSNAESLSVGIGANLSLPLIKQIMINGNYKTMFIDSNQFNFADINVSKKIGPGRLSFGLVGANGRVYDVNILYSASVKF